MKKLIPAVVACALLGSILPGCRNGNSTSSGPDAVHARSDNRETEVTAIKRGQSNASSASPTAPNAKANSAASDVQSTEPTALIYGRILSPGGDPVSSVTVTFQSLRRALDTGIPIADSFGSAVTGNDGKYAVRAPISYAMRLQVTGNTPPMIVAVPDRNVFHSGAHPRPGLTKLQKDITLLPGNLLEGSVVDENGNPLPGVPVQFYPSAGTDKGDLRLREVTKTTTTAEGNFRLEQIATARWYIGAAHPDYVPMVQQIDIPTTEPLVLRFTSRGGTVTGHVKNKLTDSIEAGIVLALDGEGTAVLPDIAARSTKSDANGAFRFEHVPEECRIGVLTDANSTLGPISPPLKIRSGDNQSTDITVFVYPGHTITGRVFDKDTNDGIPGAKVAHSTGTRWSEPVTDAQGEFRLEHVFSRGLNHASIFPTADGYQLDHRSDKLTVQNNKVLVSLSEDTYETSQVIPMTKLVKLRGRVVTVDDLPIPSASVQVFNTGLMPVTTTGTFEFDVPPFTKVPIAAVAESFAPTETTVEVTSRDITDIRLVLEAGATVEGVVLDPDGKPAADSIINLSGEFRSDNSTATGIDGRFSIKDLPRKVKLLATKDAFGASEWLQVELTPGEVRSGLELRLRTPMIISGRLLKSDRTPVKSGWISAYSNTTSKYSKIEPDGSFKFTELAEGLYVIRIESAPKTVTGVKAGTTDLEIVLDDVKVQSGKNKLIGTVVDDVSGERLKDFTVSSNYAVDLAKRLDQPGKFELSPMVDRQIYTVTISSPDYLKQDFATYTAEGGETIEQTFRLSKGGAITGRVVTKGDGKPIPGIVVVNWGDIQVFNREQKKPLNHTVTDADGKFVLAPVHNGDNYVLAKGTAPYTENGRTAKVKSEQTTDMGDIELGSGGTISGIVVRGAKDEPVPGVTVKLHGTSLDLNMDRKTTTDADGKFKFEGLPELDYNVSAEGVTKTTIIEGDKVVDMLLRLGGGTMKGTVRRGNTLVAATVQGTGPDGREVVVYAQSGEYNIRNVLPGEYQFTITPQENYHLVKRETVEVPDRAEFTKDFDLPNGQIEVTVVNASGEAVADASVAVTQKSSNTGVDQRWVTRQTAQQRTDSSGKAKFDGLSAGVYGVTASKVDVGTAMRSNLQVKETGMTPVDVTLGTDGGTLVSLTLNYTTGQPMQEPWCYLHSDSGPFKHKARRDESGNMTITNIPPGVYTTNVSYWGFSQNEKQIEIKSNETAHIEDVLYPAGAIHWKLKRSDGTPVAGARVTITPQDTTPPEQPRFGATDATGEYVERGLAGGTYQMIAELNGKQSPAEMVTVQAGQNALKETLVPGW